VKIISKKEKNEKQLRNLKTEMEIMKTLRNPNIVSLVDVWEEEEDIYLVMELYVGRREEGGGRREEGEGGQHVFIFFLSSRQNFFIMHALSFFESSNTCLFF
jgi:hypothetical protein